MLPAPTLAELALFTGRDESTFPAYATQALAQATLLFSIVTKLDEYPEDPDGRQLAINAILEMADRMQLEQPYAASKASPFQSETIGSYSYSKGSAFTKAREGAATGLFWWDLALDELSLADRAQVSSSSVAAFEREITTASGDRTIVGPADCVESGIGFYNANTRSDPRS